MLEQALHPGERVTRERVVRYVADLQGLNASGSVFTNIARLWTAMRALMPEQDWQWLGDLAMRLKRTVTPVRDKRENMVPAAELFEFGVRLMREAEGENEEPPWRQAAKFRDGFMIALLAARPLRIGNLTMIEIDRHLVRVNSGYRLRFSKRETKTRRELDFALPQELVPDLEAYLRQYRPALCAHANRDSQSGSGYIGKRLWISSRAYHPSV